METQISIYSKKFTKVKNLILSSLAALIVLEMAVIYAPQYVPVIKQDLAIATSNKPEKITELYFENHTQLPDEIYPTDQYRFIFTIHNMEQETVAYKYRVYIKRDEAIIMLDENEVEVADGQKVSVKEEFGPLLSRKLEVVVELVNKNQKISFWMKPEGEKIWKN